MKINEMNAALLQLCEKYAVPAAGSLVSSAAGSIGAAAELKMNDGSTVKLLPWRKERRFTNNLPSNSKTSSVGALKSFLRGFAKGCVLL